MNDEQHQNIGELRPQYQTYDRQKCFIAYSEQAYWSTDLLEAASEVLSEPEFNLEPDYARKHYISDVPLRQKALELIANARYGIYDLSWWRRDNKSPWQIPRNVFIELGVAIALNRPTLLLCHESNKEEGLELPNCLHCLSDQVLEFSGKYSLKKVLLKHLPTWINKAPEKAWWNRHCIFGNRICEYREAHPRTEQFGQNTLNCSIADGTDSSRSDFRHIVEEVLNRFCNVNYTYLDNLTLEKGYNFLLCTNCQKIRSSPLAIYRITSKTPPEAFIAIGISLALEAQFGYKIFRILITEDIQIVPSLLSGYEVVVAKSDKDKKDKLRQIIPNVIKRVRETTWKPRPLPFIDISVNLCEEIQIDAKDSLIQNSAVIDTTASSNRAKLSDSEQKLWEAMVDAFPNINQLEVVLNDAFNVRLKEITRLRNIVKAVLSVISWAESKGTLEQLIKSAYKHNPSNIKLGTITKELYPQLFLSESSIEETLDPTAFIPIEELQLSVRAYNCLKRAQINSVADLLDCTQEDLLEIKNFGQKSVEEVIEALKRRLGIILPKKMSSQRNKNYLLSNEDFIIPEISDLKDLLENSDIITPRERDIVRLCYGLDDGRKKTWEEIAYIFNIEQEQVKEICITVVNKLRNTKIQQN